eukprot:6458895-Amphidinium_carterae.2
MWQGKSLASCWQVVRATHTSGQAHSALMVVVCRSQITPEAKAYLQPWCGSGTSCLDAQYRPTLHFRTSCMRPNPTLVFVQLLDVPHLNDFSKQRVSTKQGKTTWNMVCLEAKIIVDRVFLSSFNKHTVEIVVFGTFGTFGLGISCHACNQLGLVELSRILRTRSKCCRSLQTHNNSTESV